MQKRFIGNTAIEVSVLGLGTVKFGRNEGVKYPTPFVLPTANEIQNLFSVAEDLGINLLDTAPAYGSSEERVGKALQGRRHHWVISTKVGEEFSEGVSYFDFSRQGVHHSIERSLRRLNTDYLDIVLVHSNGDDQRIIEEQEIFHTLALLKQTGKIRAYGMSTKTVSGGLLTVKMADIAMVTFNPTYEQEREVIMLAHQQQKGIFIKKALMSGHLQNIKSSHPILDSFRFIFSEPGVTSVIIGSINKEHLRQNAMYLNFLLEEQAKSLKNLRCFVNVNVKVHGDINEPVFPGYDEL